MSLLSQKERELTIIAFNYYTDFLNSEISFIKFSGLDDDPNYIGYKKDLYRINDLFNSILSEHCENDY